MKLKENKGIVKAGKEAARNSTHKISIPKRSAPGYKKTLPSKKELDTLDASILAADPLELDLLIKGLKKQINSVTNKVREFKKLAFYKYGM